MDVKFWSTRGNFGEFSNFSKHPIIFKGVAFRTSEHLYQSYKFQDGVNKEAVISQKTPKLAADIGRETGRPLREDWEDIKVSIMFLAVGLKLMQHDYLLMKLMSTGDRIIVEDSPIDYYWGCGADNSGKNMLGKVFMFIRHEIDNGITIEDLVNQFIVDTIEY